MKIAVVALGKIGLPLAVQFADAGHDVVGIDVQQCVVDEVNAAREPFLGEAHLAEKLAELVPAGRLRATTDYSEAIGGVDVIVIVVPLFVNDETWEPDFGWMEAATRSFSEYLTPGTLISYETTLPVGTTRNRWKPLIEEISGLTEGEDFHLVFSPERVLTGRVFADLRRYPKLIGGLSVEGAQYAREFYEAVLSFDERPDLDRPNGVWDLGSAEAAEMAKLAETTYRDVNIGLANQYARFADAHGINLAEVIQACNSQPYSHIHRPGISVGGHCIPVYPRLYLSTDNDASIVRTARLANAEMPHYVVGKGVELLGSLGGQKVVVAGISYRGGVKEHAFSGVFATVQAAEEAGAEVYVQDPLYTAEEVKAFGFTPYIEGDPADVLIIHTDHEHYREWSAEQFPGIRLLLDGRGVTDADRWAGTVRYVLGRGGVTNP